MLNFIISKLTPSLIFLIVIIYFKIFKSSLQLTNKEEIFALFGLILFAVSWLLINKFSKPKMIIFFILLGPYLLTTLITQSGLITDRSRDIRESIENVITTKNLDSKIIYVKSSDIKDVNTHSKIIRIALLTPNLGNSIDTLDHLQSSELAWATEMIDSNYMKGKYEVIFTDNNISPWKLIKKLN